MGEFLFKVSSVFFVVTSTVWLFHKLRFPGVVALIVTGVVIGPYGLGLLDDKSQIKTLAELGIVLLMFSIGLDFNRERLEELQRAARIGFIQIGFCIVVVFIGLILLFDISWEKALFFGFLVSHTSSTLMLKIYSERGELTTTPVRLGLGVSITQDLSSVPMLVVLPLMTLGGSLSSILLNPKILYGAGIIFALLFVLRWFVPVLLQHVVQTRSRELILFFLMLVTLAASWATQLAGLSAALGAFIAGLALASSPYSHQIHAEVSPLRDLLVSLFFVSVGMLLNTKTFFSYVHIFLPVLLVVIVVKYFSGFLPVLAWGYPLRIATLTGAAIAQVGEFSLVLALAGLSLGLISNIEYQICVIISVISMLLSPYIIASAPQLFNLIHRLPVLRQLTKGRLEVKANANELLDLDDHVLIAGYGLNGQNLVRALRSLDIPYAAIELNPELVGEAQAANEQVFYGDCTRPDVLRRMQIKKARVFVVAISDPHATRTAVQVARHENSSVHIIVRTRYVHEIEPLLKIGANEVIPEEFETSLEILARTLHEYQIPRKTLDQAVLGFRKDAYRALREHSPMLVNQKLFDELSLTLEIESVKVKHEYAALGKSLRELELPSKTGVVILAVRRGDEVISPFPADQKILEHDTIIMVGRHQQILDAIELLEGKKGVAELS